jgi:hypothetical protein
MVVLPAVAFGSAVATSPDSKQCIAAMVLFPIVSGMGLTLVERMGACK